MTGSLRFAIGVFLLIGFVGCSGLTHKRNEAVLAKVRKIAVAGFTVREPAPPGGMLDEHSMKLIEEMHLNLIKAFAKQMAWQVVPASPMKKNPGYQVAYNKTMKGFQNKMPASQNQRKISVDEIMDNDSLRILGSGGRTQLMKALAVDALVTAEVTVILSGTSVMGIGNLYPKARLSFQLYSPNADTPDWFEGNLEGQESKKSLGVTAFVDVEEMNRLALESTRSAYAKIGVKK